MVKHHLACSFGAALQAMGRGPFGFGRGRRGQDFIGGSGIPGGRKLSSADFQLFILALLKQHPAHGYELIRAIEERSNGFYIPSPDVIYPALTYFEEIGQAAVEHDGNRKLYRITDEGRQYLEANRAKVEATFDALSRVGSQMEQVREAFAGLDAPDPVAADECHRARHALKHALIRTRNCTPGEARRIAAVLGRAVCEILNVVSRRQA